LGYDPDAPAGAVRGTQAVEPNTADAA